MTLHCPVCSMLLETMPVADFAVAVCRQGCAGMWFADGTLCDVDDACEVAGECLAQLHGQGAPPRSDKRYACPCCAGITMLRHRYGPTTHVEVDTCPSCGGVWLDGGELARLRNENLTSENRTAAARAYVDSALTLSSHAREENRRVQWFYATARFLGHLWHDYGLLHFRGRDWPPWRGSFRE